MSIKVLQLHKRMSYEYKYIQDKYAFNTSSKAFSLADGTTQSFNSEMWAALITKSFADSPTFKSNELIGNFKRCVQDYKNDPFEYSLNPARASLEKAKQKMGGTATFLGIQFKENNRVDVISCGDTNLFIVNPRGKTTAFPFEDINSLDSNNRFINTKELISENYESYMIHKSFIYDPNAIIILATDALSRLILTKPTVISELIQIKSFNELHRFCMKYWESKELQEDDISAIIISTSNLNNSIKRIFPPEEFSFPEIKVQEFTPSFERKNNSSNLSMTEMKQIPAQLNNISNDLRKVNDKIRLNKVLIVILLLLTSLNSLILFFERNSSPNDINSKKVEQPITGENLRPAAKTQDLEKNQNTERTEQKTVSEIRSKTEILPETRIDSIVKDSL